MNDDHSKTFQCLFFGLYGIEFMYILVNTLDLNTYEIYVYVISLPFCHGAIEEQNQSPHMFAPLMHEINESFDLPVCIMIVILYTSFCFVLSSHFGEQNPTSYV